MWGLVLSIIRRYSTNKSSAALSSQMAKLHKLGHKKDAKQLETRHNKVVRQALDKQMRIEDRLKGMDKLVAQAHRELQEEAMRSGKTAAK